MNLEIVILEHKKKTKKKIVYNNFIELYTQPARDVPGTSPEDSLKVLKSVTSKRPSGDS